MEDMIVSGMRQKLQNYKELIEGMKETILDGLRANKNYDDLLKLAYWDAEIKIPVLSKILEITEKQLLERVGKKEIITHCRECETEVKLILSRCKYNEYLTELTHPDKHKYHKDRYFRLCESCRDRIVAEYNEQFRLDQIRWAKEERAERLAYEKEAKLSIREV